MTVRGFAPFAINAYDNPETIRLRKYATGAHLFARGVGTGRTPKEVVWKRDRARLYRYESDVEIRFSVPIVLVYALILRPYVLDLVPGNSLVEYLKKEGFDAYLLEWGVPTAENSGLTLEDYVLSYMPEALGRVRETSGADGVTLFGYCQGGTMATIHAALSPDSPANLILLATPTDFAPDGPGFFGLWTLCSRQGYFDPNLLIGPSGNVPADAVHRFIEGAARARRRSPRRVRGLVDTPRARYARRVVLGDEQVGGRQSTVPRRGVPAVDPRLLPSEQAREKRARAPGAPRGPGEHQLPHPEHRG